MYSWAAALVPLLIPLCVWYVLQRRDAVRDRQLAARVPAEETVRQVDLIRKRPPRFPVREFTSGGAVGASAKSTLVRDVLLGEHECVLFSYVEELFGRSRPWGHVLDAGTGSHSLGWMAALATTQLTAVTGDEEMLRDLQREFEGKLRPHDELVIGNWNDEAFLEGRTFDVIVADYLLGALVSGVLLHEGRTLAQGVGEVPEILARR